MNKFWKLTAGELIAGYQSKEFQPSEAVNALLKRIDQLNKDLCAFTQIDIEGTQRPVADVPAGLDENELPIGLQIVGHRNSDRKTLAIATEFRDALRTQLPTCPRKCIHERRRSSIAIDSALREAGAHLIDAVIES